jgi:hypothetical protein
VDEELPPIFRTPGLRFVGIGRTERGNSYLKFISHEDGHEQSVIVYIITDQPTKFKYGYSLWDRTTRSLVTYNGSFGDPSKDNLGDIIGI